MIITVTKKGQNWNHYTERVRAWVNVSLCGSMICMIWRKLLMYNPLGLQKKNIYIMHLLVSVWGKIKTIPYFIFIRFFFLVAFLEPFEKRCIYRSMVSLSFLSLSLFICVSAFVLAFYVYPLISLTNSKIHKTYCCEVH